VENAIKIARTYTRKQAVVSFDHAYHGRTNLTMALTAKSMPYKHGFGPVRARDLPGAAVVSIRDAEFGKELATDGELAARRAITVIDKQVAPTTWPRSSSSPSRVRAASIVPADGFLPALLGLVPQEQRGVHRRRSADGFAARRDVRLRTRRHRTRPDLHRQGHRPTDCRCPRSRGAEIMDAPHVSGLGGT